MNLDGVSGDRGMSETIKERATGWRPRAQGLSFGTEAWRPVRRPVSDVLSARAYSAHIGRRPQPARAPYLPVSALDGEECLAGATGRPFVPSEDYGSGREAVSRPHAAEAWAGRIAQDRIEPRVPTSVSTSPSMRGTSGHSRCKRACAASRTTAFPVRSLRPRKPAVLPQSPAAQRLSAAGSELDPPSAKAPNDELPPTTSGPRRAPSRRRREPPVRSKGGSLGKVHISI
jgi:hypothetical protein